MPSSKMLFRLIVQSSLWIVLMAAILFGAAGSWRWPQGWAFLAIFVAGSILFCAWLWRRDPALLAARMSPVVQKGQARWDQVFMICAVAAWNAWLAFMAADAERWKLSHMPAWLNAAGGVLIVAGFGATVPVFAANSFASPVVRVQEERGQRLIDTGPYAVVRHPMYAAALLYLLGLPLLLGSWWGLAVLPFLVAGLAPRALREEALLKRELPGYAAYMERVRWRLVPHIW
ncbi:MAG TPA: isoprenylcysteine carboxylmethyltransferase family protein [Rhizomicrobium sp.]|nr:isoprenylcysteine carboxylmethyltransferase family protein [Rhizomicrobium sp.]